MNRTCVRFIICWALVAFWMVAIFSFSAKAVDDSDAQSGIFAHIVASLVVPGYAQMSAEEQTVATEPFNYPVRKAAHVSEYALLGVLVSTALAVSLKRKNAQENFVKVGGFALLICVSYAASDEIHQLFVPGRSSQFTDVCIDTLGALAGILVVLMIRALWERRNQKNVLH
jgi:VanZ family protein